MKLKLHGNSIRLRLNRREVAHFAETGKLEEVFEHGPGPGKRLAYGIEARNIGQIGVRVDAAGIFVVLPLAVASDWTGSERVGVSGEADVSEGRHVSILVEKEFRRLHGASNDPELYPNPLEAALKE